MSEEEQIVETASLVETQEGTVEEIERQVYIIDPVDKDNVIYLYLGEMDIYEMNYCNGKLYGIISTQKEPLKLVNDQIMIMEIDSNKKVSGDVVEEKTEYMYVVNDVIYYSDSEPRKLISFNPETEEDDGESI